MWHSEILDDARLGFYNNYDACIILTTICMYVYHFHDVFCALLHSLRITTVSFPSVFIPNYFRKLPTCLHNLMKTSINLVYGQKLKTSCSQNFCSSYCFDFDSCENARKRSRVYIDLGTDYMGLIIQVVPKNPKNY